MRFGVLGPIAAWTDDGRPAPVQGAKVRALLADLLAHRGEPVTADRLVDDLWGEAPESTNPAGMLSSKVSQLRRVLDVAEPGARVLVVSPPPGYTLAVGPEAVDAERFTALVDEATTADDGGTDPARVVELLQRALALWRGPAYGEVADLSFARGLVAQLDERRLTAHEALARARLALGDHARVADDLAPLVAEHPWREELRLAHVLASYRAGRQPDALASFEDHRRALRDELGLEPSRAASELHLAVLEQDPRLDLPVGTAGPRLPSGSAGSAGSAGSEGSAGSNGSPGSAGSAGSGVASESGSWGVPGDPGRTVHRPAARLPALRTEVVGRDAEVAELATALDSPGLVTLAGPGGVGKTTLALAAARTVAADRRDGAWFVDLSAVEPVEGEGAVDLVADVVGEALALRRPTDLPLHGSAGWVADALRDHRLVLVLDNCEHLVEPAAALADRLLTDAAGVTVLVTSREPLGVAGERVLPLVPLAVPRPRDQGVPELVAASPAVQLVVARARAAGARLEVDGTTAPLLGTLCRRLDGLPLALELAATRVPALGLPAVVARLGDRFRLLGSGRRAGPERHRTLEALLDWSWDLLESDERRVLRRLAVHADGCTLAAATAVGGDPGPGDPRDGADPGEPGDAGRHVPGDADETEDVLARLVERSLVVVDHRPPGPRYRLLESIGAYATHRLADAGEEAIVRRRHLDWYLDVAERADAALRGPDQERCLAVLDAESANLHAALDAAVDDGLADHALRLVSALGWYWVLRSRTGSSRRMLDRALGARVHSPVASLPAAWAEVFRCAAALGRRELDDPSTRCAEVLAAFEERDAAERGRAAALMGWAALEAGLIAEAERLLADAVATAVATGDRWGEAVALTSGCMVAHMHGDTDGLEAAAVRADELFAELGDTWGRLAAGEWLGAHAELVGDLERGVKILEDGLDEAERLGLWRQVAGRIGLLGWIALQREDWARASSLGEQARRLAVEQGERSIEVLSGMVIGFTARQTADLDTAERVLHELLASSGLDLDGLLGPAAAPQGIEDAPHVSSVVSELAYVAELRGDLGLALAGHRWVVASTRAAGYPRGVVGGLEGVAAALAALGETERAARLLGAAADGHARVQIPRSPAEQRDVDRALDRIVAVHGADTTDRLLAEGRSRGVDGVEADVG